MFWYHSSGSAKQEMTLKNVPLLLKGALLWLCSENEFKKKIAPFKELLGRWDSSFRLLILSLQGSLSPPVCRSRVISVVTRACPINEQARPGVQRKGLEQFILGENTPFYCKSPGCLVNLSCQSCWNNYVAGGRSGEVASFVVWDTSGSPMGIQTACVSCCSTSLQAASALKSLHKSRNGNAGSTGKALRGGGIGGPGGHLSVQPGGAQGEGAPKLPWGHAEIGLGQLPAPSQPAAPAASHPGSACPHCAFCSTS